MTALPLDYAAPRPPHRVRERLAFPLLMLGLGLCLLGYAAAAVSVLRFLVSLFA